MNDAASSLVDAFLVLSLGAAAVVLLSQAASLVVRRASSRRALWQAACLGIALLVLGELSGIFPCVWSLIPRLHSPPEGVTISGVVAPAPPPQLSQSPPDQSASAYSSLAEAVADLETLEAEEAAITPPPSGGEQRQSFDLALWLGVLWLAGVAALALRSLVGRALLWVFSLRLRPLEDRELGEVVELLRVRLGLKRRVRIAEAAGIQGPMAFGLLRPTIVLPLGFRRSFDAPERQAILAHELAHLAAHDALWSALAGGICVVLWWHPLVWWSRRQLRSELEFAADEATAVIDEGPQLLAECLVRFGERMLKPATGGGFAVQGLGRRSSLGRRVHRLLGIERLSWRPPAGRRIQIVRVFVKVSGALALGAAAAGGTSWARSAPLEKGESPMRNLKQRLVQHSLAGLLVAFAVEATMDEVPAQTALPPGGLPDSSGKAPGASNATTAPVAPAQPAAPGVPTTQSAPAFAAPPAWRVLPGADWPLMAGAGEPLASPGRPSTGNLAVDLVGLATAVSDALEQVELCRWNLQDAERRQRLGVAGEDFSEKARIQARAAERKLGIYRRLTQSLLTAQDGYLASLRTQRENLAVQLSIGKATPSDLQALDAQVNLTAGQLEILRSILEECGDAPAAPPKAGALDEPKSGSVDTHTVPRTVRPSPAASATSRARSGGRERVAAAPRTITLEVSGSVPLDYEGIETFASSVPEPDRAATEIHLQADGSISADQLVELIGALKKAGFQRLTVVPGGAAASPANRR
jgi:beta-lactamase regulating signal transducer with metallopeptidase domain